MALNEAVLAEAVERHVALLDDATADLEEQAQLLRDGGSVCRFSGQSAERPLAALVKAPALQEKRIAAIAGGAALLCAVLVISGQALFFKPPAAPAPVVVAKELTPEQSAALRDADKLNKIVQKLDAKTRNAILAEMQKPSGPPIWSHA